jgi:hypothetical protein
MDKLVPGREWLSEHPSFSLGDTWPSALQNLQRSAVYYFCQ